MLHVCELRGEDSTGIFSVKNTESEAKITKVVGGTREMFETAAWDKLSFYDKRAVVGHCRKATVGLVNRSTAHPFVRGNLTGVHNGTLRNWRDLPVEAESVDSSTLYSAMDKNGVKETIEAVDGAYAMIWWDAAEETVNVIRNKERPLYYAFNEAGSVIFLASEAWMITVNADRNGVKLMNLTPKESYVSRALAVTEDTLWRFRPMNNTKTPLSFLKDVELKGGVNLPAKKVAPFQNRYDYRGSNHSPYGNITPIKRNELGQAVVSSTTDNLSSASTPNGSNETDGQQSKTSVVLLPSSSDAGSDEPKKTEVSKELNDQIKSLFKDDYPDELRGNGDLLLSKDEFQTLVDPNCVWCQQGYSFEELRSDKLGEWVDDTSYICSECLVSPSLAQAGYTPADFQQRGCC